MDILLFSELLRRKALLVGEGEKKATLFQMFFFVLLRVLLACGINLRNSEGPGIKSIFQT